MSTSLNLPLNSSGHLHDVSIKPTKASVSKNCTDYVNKIHLSEIIKFILKGLAFIATLGIGYIIGKQIYQYINHLNCAKDAKEDASKINSSNLSFLLVGMTGYGKSSTGNSILGKKLFGVGVNMSAETDKCQIETCEVDGRQVTVVDTPGFFGKLDDCSELLPESVAKKLLKEAFNSPDSKEGFDAIVLVLKYGKRITKEQVEVLDACKAMFGHDVLQKHGMVAITRADIAATQNIAMDKWLSEGTGPAIDYLKKCQGRYVCFNNQTQDEAQLKIQRNQLFKHASSMKHHNKKHTKKDFQKVLKSYVKSCEKQKESEMIKGIFEGIGHIRDQILSPQIKSDQAAVNEFIAQIDSMKSQVDTIKLHDDFKPGLYKNLDDLYEELMEL